MARFSPTIVDHFTSPRNCGRLPSADVAAFVGNPVCGDQILLTARIDGDAVSDIAFEAFGCSASLAIASILTERLTGLTVPEVAAVTTDQVLQWSGGLSPDQRHVAELGADVAHRLAGNYCDGLSDDGLSCGA
ncbi:MAG TPA: iron-sulfur cluster assembly scaffold protein [Mycobacterium sp.]|nr:iron-sulfur cluster assembly scaffold protein [Mycobacterium sp.]HNM09850.1 iron-sulfur cluster assembly scaffold protein [Mycobacterium sp.]HNM83754.1 iron-sulfur cluster assembly scaffold protein [Mycobacterium sp.]HRD10620.1 iron-sulfur cluster assembly scaffold protein [Mycobacterium sp.]